MPDITVREVYVMDNYFGTPSSYPYSVSGGGAGASLQWVGATAGGVGTYLSSTTIQSEEMLRFHNDFALVVGNATGVYSYGGDYMVTVGSTTVGQMGHLQLVGNSTASSTTRLGGISWHNESSTATNKISAEFIVYRDDDENAGEIWLQLGYPSAGAPVISWVATSEMHTWYASGAAETRLTSTSFFPYFDGGNQLGDDTHRWNYLYTNNVRDEALVGTGTRMVVANATGDLGIGYASDILTFGEDYQIPYVATGSSGAESDFAYSANFTYDGNLNILNGGRFDQYGPYILVGSDSPGFLSRTNATTKVGAFVIPHYTNSEEPFGITMLSGPSNNQLYLGGGSTSYNAATKIWLMVAADQVTTVGTAIAQVLIDGFHVDVIRELTESAGVTINDEVYLPTIGGTGTGTSMIYYNRSTGELTYADAPGGTMVYPGAGIAVSTGSAWGTSITDNSTNWNTAYTHSQVTTGNPHSIGYADISDFNTGVSTYETSHTYVVYNNQANTYTAGSKQSVQSSATTAGLRLVGYAGNPSGAVAGDVWYNTSTNRLMYRGSTTSREVVARTLAQTLTTKTIALGSNTVSGTMAQFDSACTDGNFIYDSDFSANGIMRRSGSGTYTVLTGSTSVDTVEATLTNDSTHIPTSSAVVAAIAAAGGGTVTSVAAGSGMNFTTITTSGSVTMGTPSTCTNATTNSASGTTHTHAITGFLTGNQTITLSGDVSGSGTTSIAVTIASAAVESGMLNANVISGQTATTTLTGTDEILVSDGGVLRRADLIGLITYQTELASGLASTDELLVSDAGAMRRMDVSVLQTYMQNNLTGIPSYGTSNQIPHMNTGGTDFDYDTGLTWDGAALWVDSSIRVPWIYEQGTGNGVKFGTGGRWMIYDLPAFSMGDGGVTDEYLVLCPLWSSGLVAPVGLNGRIIFQRGGTSSGNNMSEIHLVLQSAYNTDVCYAYEQRGDPIFTSIDEISIGGVDYWALKARTGGGGSAYSFKFVGEIYNLQSDTNFLTNVRASDSAVTVVTTNVHLPHYTNDEGVITLGSGTVLEVDGSRIIIGGETNTLSPIPDYFLQVGSHTLGKYGAVTVKGYQTSDTEQVGSYYFQNFGSASTGNIICEMSAFRENDNDAGHFFLYVTDSGGTKDTAYDVHSTQHAWSINGINELYLNASTLNPAVSTGLGLGTSSLPFGTCYLNRLYLPGITYTDRSDSLQYYASTDEVSYYAEASDIRFKDVIGPIENASAGLRKIAPFMFTINELGHEKIGWDMEKIRYGISAQDTLPVFEHTVSHVNAKGAEEYFKVDYDSFIPILHAAHNEHSVSLEDHEREIGLLKDELKLLKKDIEILINKFK